MINKSDLERETEAFKISDSHASIKKDVQMIKKNLEEKISKNKLAKIRSDEINKRRYSYFNEKKEEVKNDEDKTKLFFDENVLKKTFLKKEQLTKNNEIIDSKKKLPKMLKNGNKLPNSQNNGDLLTALNTPNSIAEIKENRANEKRETIFFNESEIDLGIRQKKKLKEVVGQILNEPIKITITSILPENLKKIYEDERRLKARALQLRTFLINLGISHNRITIKNFKKKNVSKNWKNELVLSFIGT